MDMSSVSTEALRQELRFRQARLAAPLERSCGKRPRIPEVQDHSDHDSLFVPERRTNFTYEDSFRSREGSKQHESYPLQSMPERKRRRARSPEVRVSVRFSHRDSRFPATQQQRPDIEPAKEIKFETVASRCQSLTQQEEEDRRFAERLQAEEDLVFAETPLSSLPYANQVLHNDDCQSAIGSKSDPIDLDLTPFSINRSHLAEAEAGKQAYMSALYQREMDDAAMALQLHEEEQQAQEERERQAALQSHDCSVCSDKTLFIDLPSLSSCLHQPEVCSGCYVSWIASQLEANGWQEVRCPGTSCKVNLAYEEIKAFASEDAFERYDTFKARDALVSDPNFRWCRTEGCASGQIHDSDEVGNTFICVECDTHFCTVHDVVHHDGETCEAYEYRTSGQKERDERKKNEEASEEAVGKLTKKCPKETCGCPIQKNGGCNHMTCWKCQHNFCFVCLSSNWGRCGHLHV